jgi:uncharacterized delta-60 repeat protein
LVLGSLVATTACGDSPTEPEEPELPDPVELEAMARNWVVSVVPRGGLVDVEVDSDHRAGRGVISESFIVGEMSVYPLGYTSEARAEVYSSDDGASYAVSAQAPGWFFSPDSAMGAASDLEQFHSFRKVASDASLEYVISKVVLEGIDDNFQSPETDGCSWTSGLRPLVRECEKLIHGTIVFDLEALHISEDADGGVDSASVLFTSGGRVRLFGFRDAWRNVAYTAGDAMRPLWSLDDFEAIADPLGGGRGGQLRLESPITIEIPLDSVAVGEVVLVTANVKARSISRRGNEAYISSYFRDPFETEGAAFAVTGLDPAALPDLPVMVEPQPPCVVGTPVTGTLQFDSLEYYEPEQPGAAAWITVSRAGGTDGMMTARFVTSDGDAKAGADYEPVDTYVRFAHGEDGTRVVEVPIVTDTVAEADQTVVLTLSEIPGCGTVGAPSSATLTIQDDDRPPPSVQTYTVGGTVTGLVGTGLVLRNLSTDDLTPSNGPFVFGRQFVSGSPYDVTVATQPNNPAQTCTVTDGSGTIADQDVTGVLVDCVTVATDDDLDPDFGIAGKVTSAMVGGANAMALQPDGKVVVLGDRLLARYESDGTLDTTFGSGGEAPVVFTNALDRTHGLALQPDGRIVVVGYTWPSTDDDFAVARFNPDGTPDTSFGINGQTTTDLGGGDRAWAVALQSGGSIVVAGHGVAPSGSGNDFAVARYTPSGVLDVGFGLGGIALTNIGGMTDLAYGLAIQADDKILVAGRVGDGGGEDPDFGVVRYEADGAVDATFAVGGVYRVPSQDISDQAADIAVRADGSIVVAGSSRTLGQTTGFSIRLLTSAGSVETTFGTAGETKVLFSSAQDYLEAVVVESDGGIIAVGQLANESQPDFAVVRLTSDGLLDAAFGDGGQMQVDFFGQRDVAQAVAVQPDGRVVVAGSAQNGASVGLGLARLVR